MGDHFRRNLENLKYRLKNLPKKEKKNIIFIVGVSIFIMGVFFYPTPREISLAKNTAPKAPASLWELVPEKKLGSFAYKELKGKRSIAINDNSFKNPENLKKGENKIAEMVAGRPMENMVVHISKRDKKVASFLVAIAKKESDWGKYAPRKSGRDCYNYWGYRGKENTTESGYSCFDSPEQAIRIVGDKIESLLAQNINTPERLIVWKCGRTCAGHDPAGVRKWISDVALYYGKLNS